MNAWDRQSTVAPSQTRAMDQGLRSYMLKVYNMMASGILLTAVIAYFAGTSEAFLNLVLKQGENGAVGVSLLGYVCMFAPLAMVLFMMAKLRTMSTQTLAMTFWAYATLMGLSLFSIFLVYTQVSILKVLFVTAGTFGLLSMYGYTTKRDLTSMASFLMVGCFALILVSLVNILLLHSSMLDMMLSCVGVLVALGFTAYNTQTLKDNYYSTAGSPDLAKRASILGALQLYMDFVMLFVNLLRLMGDRR